jgi:MFS family permease
LLIPVILPEITAEYGLSNFTAGVLLSCFNLSYSLLQTLFGYLSMKISRKTLLILGFAITSGSFLITGFTYNIVICASLFFLAGIGGSTYHPNGMPLLSEYYIENRGQASGFHQTGGSMGSFIAPISIGALLLFVSWRSTVVTFSILGIIVCIVLWLFLAEPKRFPKEIKQEAKGTIMTSIKPYFPALTFIIASTTSLIGLRGVDSFANQYFTYGRGINSIWEASLLFSMLKVAGLFSAPLCGKLSDVFGRKRILIILIAMESIFVYALIATPLTFLVFPCIFFGFASFGLLATSDAFLADLTPKEHSATLFGIYYTMSFGTSAFIPPILGKVIDIYGFSTGFMILSAIVPFSIPLLLQIKNVHKT